MWFWKWELPGFIKLSFYVNSFPQFCKNVVYGVLKPADDQNNTTQGPLKRRKNSSNNDNNEVNTQIDAII